MTTPSEYIAKLPPDRRKALTEVRKIVNAHLPKGYKESMGWGVITWEVPLKTYPDTYNGKPLCYVALANQKNYASLYLMPAYGLSEARRKLENGFRDAGLKLDMGKSCIHFKSAADLPLDVIGDIVAATPVAQWVAFAELARQRPRRKPPAAKRAAKKK